MQSKKWQVLHELKGSSLDFSVDEVINILLKNRGVTTKDEVTRFLHPQLSTVTTEAVGIDKKNLKRTIRRVKQAIESKEKIVIFGDYDVDGICGTAILWETLYTLKANVIPYIPHRVEEGYGLSIKGIENLLVIHPDIKLIITVDNGIVANGAVNFANSKKIDVIITDHHVKSETMPEAFAIVHTTKLCGAGVAYLLSESIKYEVSGSKNDYENDIHLELVALATVADLVPLTGENRAVTKYGLEKLAITHRPGLLALYQEAGITPPIDVYKVGHIIAPRLNASGRLASAMDSLRLICTNRKDRAGLLAEQLGDINRERQRITKESSAFASEMVSAITIQKKLLFIVHESYEQGVIGLVAGRLVEEFYRPAIVVAKGETFSKASARSIAGFNIIESIRSASTLLVDAGGHPMAAGFTVATEKITLLQKALEDHAEANISDDLLKRTIKVDLELPFSSITAELFQSLQNLAPFGQGNAEPTFVSRGVVINDIRLIGSDRKHLKLRLGDFDAIGFGMGEMGRSFKAGEMVDVVYTIDENTWNGRTSLQLKIKDLKQHAKEK